MSTKAHSLEQRLNNYKEMHKGTAKDKNCYEEFMATKTLTQAKKVLFGVKKKEISGWKGCPDIQQAVKGGRGPGGRNF